jgi:predicted TIM-barrel enzyme
MSSTFNLVPVLGMIKSIVGMIHVGALPGTPKSSMTVPQLVELAVKEANIYKEAGIDAIAIENMHDVPYLNTVVGPEIVATMAVLAHEVKKATNLPCGIQVCNLDFT